MTCTSTRPSPGGRSRSTGDEQRFDSRSEAFAAASAAARAASPSRVIRRAPPEAAPPSEPVARPSAPDDDHDLDEWEADEPLPAEAPYDDPGFDGSGYDDPGFDGSGYDDAPPRAGTRAPTPPGPGRSSPPPSPRRGAARTPAPPPLMAPAPTRPPGWEPASWDRLAGPPALGRSVLVLPGADAPSPWSGCERVVVDGAALAGPDLLERVRAAYLSRTAVVYEVDPALEVDPGARPGIDVYDLTPDFEFTEEAAWRLVTANAVDGRDPDAPCWPWTDRAVAAGATAAGAAEHPGADVVLPDGRPALCDGGPFHVSTAPADVVVVPFLAVERGALAPVHADDPTADLAPDQLAAVCEPGGDRSHHRAGRVGQDPGAHRTGPPPRTGSGSPSRPCAWWRSTSGPRRR